MKPRVIPVCIDECKVFGRNAFILRPSEHNDDSVLEIATDIELRDADKLQDGDIVEVEVPDP